MFHRDNGEKGPIIVEHLVGHRASCLIGVISSNLCHNPMSWILAIFYSSGWKTLSHSLWLCKLNVRVKSQTSPALSGSRALGLTIVWWCPSNVLKLFYFSGPQFLCLTNLGKIYYQLCQKLDISLGIEILEGTPIFKAIQFSGTGVRGAYRWHSPEYDTLGHCLLLDHGK